MYFVLSVCCSNSHSMILSFIWFHHFNFCALRNLVKLPVCDICNTFHVEVKTACYAFVEKYIDCESHVSSSSISSTIAVLKSITLVRLFYGLSNCTILCLFSPPPIMYLIIQRSCPSFQLGWSGGTGMERLVSKWQLHRSSIPNRIIWELILGPG